VAALVRIATRASRLARWQAERVAALLQAHGVEPELVLVSTTGDQRADVPIHTLGGTGVFVREVQSAVVDGRADIAVHSAKDLPAATPSGLALACVPERADVRDALVGASLSELHAGAVVATGSVRRRVQLAAAIDGLEFAELRGNIETRLAKAPQFAAIVVAHAALVRLELTAEVREVLDVEVMVPQVAQGALGIECRADDSGTHALLALIDDTDAHTSVRAERAFLAGLGGGCEQPLGALATIAADGTLLLDAFVADASGAIHRRRATGSSADPESVGAQVADELAPLVAPSGLEVAQVREGETA
jgi:hydroxymethylbilane synthase